MRQLLFLLVAHCQHCDASFCAKLAPASDILDMQRHSSRCTPAGRRDLKVVHRAAMFKRRAVHPIANEDNKNEPDLIEKLFGLFFGAPQEGEVAGLARTASAPDTYPATKTEFADPVEGDGEEAKILRPLLKNTNLEFLSLRLAFDANRDGWRADNFHEKVDKTGPCIVICKTEGGAVCGGYAPKGFAGYGEYRGSIAAFLYTWPDGDTSAPPVKLQKMGGAGLATIDEPETGPRFGAEGLSIPMDPGSERIARSKLGPYYERMPDGGGSVFASSDDSKRCELKELRVYVGVWPEGERIPFDGAIPFAIE